MTRMMLAAALVAVGLGMILVYTGVIGSGLIVPGSVLVGIGVVLFAVAAMMPDGANVAAHTPPSEV